MGKSALILHGGAWDWDDALDKPKAEGLHDALHIGWTILQNGGSALDAVEKAVNLLEDHPLFDAGTGSHLNAIGIVETDAILIDASTLNYGAVAGVQRVRYPISLARKVLEETDHNLFVGAGADELAARVGIPRIANLTLVTDDELAAFRNADKSGTRDTVGAIALDTNGNIAVATSTGGTPQKPAGRVGDSPLFGAGGYADARYGGAGATGHGEHSMRTLLSRCVVDQIARGHEPQEAAEIAIAYVDSVFDRSMVGTITMDRHGKLGCAHTTPKIACGWIDAEGKSQVSMSGGVRATVRL